MSKALYEGLKESGLIGYGQVILGSVIRAILNIEIPAIGTKKEFDELSLKEMGAVDYVRNILLGQGKYLSSEKGDYRILLPSENKRQVDIYMNHADKKLKRALKLSRNMPNEDKYEVDNTSARIMFRRASLRDRLIGGGNAAPMN